MKTIKKHRLSTFCLLSLLLSSPALWAAATFNFNNNQLIFPVVNVPGSGNYSATLIYNGVSFTLTSAQFASSAAVASESSPASFSNVTGKVTIPLVNVTFPNGQVLPYTAELTLVPGSNPFVFNVTAADPKATNSVDAVLENFNVDLTAKSRVDNSGNDLPEDFSPLGSSFEMNRTDELFIVGINVDVPGNTDDKAAFVELVSDGSLSSFSTDVLHTPAVMDTPWVEDSLLSRNNAKTTRAAANADLDGNGLEETVVVYWVFEDGANRIKITQFSNKENNFQATDEGTLLFVESEPDISVVGGDFDGDGVDEVAIAIATTTGIDIRIAKYINGAFQLVESANKTLTPSLSANTIYTSFAKGNLDYDNPEELALVVTELVGSDAGISRYYIFDDHKTGYAQISTAPVQGPDEIGIVKTAMVADISLGDIDGDGLDEVVMGGLTNISSGGGCKEYGHILTALDDRTHQLTPLGSKYFSHFFNKCPSFSAWRLRYLHINTVDLDGDNVAEIQANQFIYANFADADPWTELYTLPESLFFQVNHFGWFDRSTSNMEAGDVTGDGRENVIFYNPSFSKVEIWGDDQVNGWGGMATIPTAFNNTQNPNNPIVLPVNLDKDGPVLKYSEAEYRYVFTEPVLIAALAAPPCIEGVGQNTDECRTRFGTAKTVAVDAEASLTLSAGVHVGAKGSIKVFGIGAELEAIKKTTVAVTGSILAAYSLEQSVIFTTGPLQDSVIFTTIPLDQYTYTIASHPIPELVGEEIVISLPRKPITIMSTLNFYNQSIQEGDFHIGSNVFQHRVGEIDSYPSVGEKNRLTQQYFDTIFDVIENPTSALLDALDALELESDVQNVDQGTGSREVTLQVNQAFGVGVGLEVTKELEVTGEAGGAVAGFTVGASVGASLAVTKGTSTIYAGSVGAIDSANFPSSGYSYGLFAYTFRDAASEQEFEVVNYWVE